MQQPDPLAKEHWKRAVPVRVVRQDRAEHRIRMERAPEHARERVLVLARDESDARLVEGWRVHGDPLYALAGLNSMAATTQEASADTRYRDHAANERTLLAWIRTGIALMAFGFAIARFGLFLREVAQAGALHVNAVRGLGSAWFGVALVVLGLVTNAAAVARYANVRRAIEERRAGAPSPTLAYVVGITSVAVALVMALVLAVSMGD
jgi:putative membrane protein